MKPHPEPSAKHCRKVGACAKCKRRVLFAPPERKRSIRNEIIPQEFTTDRAYLAVRCAFCLVVFCRACSFKHFGTHTTPKRKAGA